MSEPSDSPGAEFEHELADRLASSCPIPHAGFRGALGRHLVAVDPGFGPRPEQLRLYVTACALAGLLLMMLGAAIGLGAF